MNILLTSNKGFLGRSLPELFNQYTTHSIFAFDKQELNILNINSIKKYIDQYNIDIIIHNAIKGGRRIAVDDCYVFYENLLMFENIASCSDSVRLVFNFDSAASFDRRFEISSANETDIDKAIPIDYYGLSKNIAAMRCRSYNNIYNLRIFNCFGYHETPERMISNNINQYILHQPMVIHQNKYMDFFYIDDLFRIITYIIDYLPIDKDINLCYNEKNTLIDICNKINGLSSYTVPIFIENNINSNSYTGNSNILNKLNIPLIGLDEALNYMYQILLTRQGK